MYDHYKKVTEDEVRAAIEPALADKREIHYSVKTGEGGGMPVDRIIATVILKNRQEITVTIRPNG